MRASIPWESKRGNSDGKSVWTTGAYTCAKIRHLNDDSSEK